MIIGLSSLSMTSIDHYDILSESDLELEAIESTTRPALGAALDAEPYWQSFNEWRCFATDIIQPYCAEIDYGKSHLPTLRISESDGKLYEFSLDPGPTLNCEETLNEWISLLENQRGVCVYAAYLQDLDAEHELWIIDTVKSYSGGWTVRQNVDE